MDPNFVKRKYREVKRAGLSSGKSIRNLHKNSIRNLRAPGKEDDPESRTGHVRKKSLLHPFGSKSRGGKQRQDGYEQSPNSSMNGFDGQSVTSSQPSFSDESDFLGDGFGSSQQSVTDGGQDGPGEYRRSKPSSSIDNFREQARVIDMSPSAINGVRRRREHAVADRPRDLPAQPMIRSAARSDFAHPGRSRELSTDSVNSGLSKSGINKRFHSSSLGSEDSPGLNSPRGRTGEERHDKLEQRKRVARPSFAIKMGLSNDAFGSQLKQKTAERETREMALANHGKIKELQEKQHERERLLDELEKSVTALEKRTEHDLDTAEAWNKLVKMDKLDACRSLCEAIERQCEEIEPIRVQLEGLIPSVVESGVNKMIANYKEQAEKTLEEVDERIAFEKTKKSAYEDERLPEWLRAFLKRLRDQGTKSKRRKRPALGSTASKRLSLDSDLSFLSDAEDDDDDDYDDFHQDKDMRLSFRRYIARISGVLSLIKPVLKIAFFSFLLSFVVITFWLA